MSYIIKATRNNGVFVYWSGDDWTDDISLAHIFYSELAATMLTLSIGGDVLELSS